MSFLGMMGKKRYDAELILDVQRKGTPWRSLKGSWKVGKTVKASPDAPAFREQSRWIIGKKTLPARKKEPAPTRSMVLGLLAMTLLGGGLLVGGRRSTR